MKILPLTHSRDSYRRVGILRANGDILSLEGHRDSVYIDRDTARSFLKRGVGYGIARRGRLTRYYPADDMPAHLLPAKMRDPLLSELQLARDWIVAHGGTMSSVQGTAVSLLRASLDAPLITAHGGPPLTRIAGGRVHSAKSMSVPAIHVWDIHAAFASTLAAFRPGGLWRHGRTFSDSGDQFIRCTVEIPEVAQWGPLPVIPETRNTARERLRNPIQYPQGCTLSGTWTGDELRAAMFAGTRIRSVERSWTLHATGAQPFALWWEWLAEGRHLPGNAGRFLKAVSQALWGVFAASSGAATRVWYVDRRRHSEALPDAGILPLRRDLPMADTLSARIRARVFHELIVPRAGDVLGVAVDGGLVRPGGEPQGTGWRLKQYGQHLRFRSIQLYSYYTPEGERVTVASGLTGPRAEHFFDHLTLERFGDAYARPSTRRLALHRVRATFPGTVLDSTTASVRQSHGRDGRTGAGEEHHGRDGDQAAQGHGRAED